MFQNDPTPVSPWVKVFLWIGVGFMGLVTIAVFGLVLLGKDAPETYVQLAHQVDREQVKHLRRLGLLGERETLIFFYGYGLSADDELVAVSGRRVAVYDRAAVEPLTSVEFSEVEDLELHRDTSFVTDSEILLRLDDGSMFSFLVSSERDGDRRVYDYLLRLSSSQVWRPSWGF